MHDNIIDYGLIYSFITKIESEPKGQQSKESIRPEVTTSQKSPGQNAKQLHWSWWELILTVQTGKGILFCHWHDFVLEVATPAAELETRWETIISQLLDVDEDVDVFEV